MAIGERIKLARSLAQKSLRQLAAEVGVSFQAISKYERGQDIPSSGILLRLAEALNVKVEFFFRTTTVALSVPSFRKRAKLPARQEKAIMGRLQEWIERYLEVELLVLPEIPRFQLPPLSCAVASVDEVEQVADKLRDAWQLGRDPINNLTELLEEQGIKVGRVEGVADFDACTFLADGNPVIAVKEGLPGDRQRFNLAYELAHLVLIPEEGVDEEKAAHRFAGAFLAPAEAVRREIGGPRHHLHSRELELLKVKYGLSMQGWLYRCRDLGILSRSTVEGYFQVFRSRGWHKQEPGAQLPPEEPKRMERLVLKGLAEGLISEARAAELLKKSLHEILEMGEVEG